MKRLMPRWSIRPIWSSVKESHGRSISSGPEDWPALALRRSATMQRKRVAEFLHRVERMAGVEPGDGRVEAAARNDQQREARAPLFVVDADRTSFVDRHGFLPAVCGPRTVPRGASGLNCGGRNVCNCTDHVPGDASSAGPSPRRGKLSSMNWGVWELPIYIEISKLYRCATVVARGKITRRRSWPQPRR